jgi:hypothetical protein
LFREAFEKLGFTIHGVDVSEFRGKCVIGVEGREPPNLYFIAERDGVVYGVDVKNWIEYEVKTRVKVDRKVEAALQLEIVPFIIARYVDREKVNEIIYEKGGLVYEYKRLLVPSTVRSLAEDAERILGYPMLAVDELPLDMISRIEDIHRRFLAKKRIK